MPERYIKENAVNLAQQQDSEDGISARILQQDSGAVLERVSRQAVSITMRYACPRREEANMSSDAKLMPSLDKYKPVRSCTWVV